VFERLLKRREVWTNREAINRIKEEFNVEYFLKQVIIVLKNSADHIPMITEDMLMLKSS